jgi:hypothetical protein
MLRAYHREGAGDILDSVRYSASRALRVGSCGNLGWSRVLVVTQVDGDIAGMDATELS